MAATVSLAYDPPEDCARAFFAERRPLKALLGEIAAGRGLCAAKALCAMAMLAPKGASWLAVAPNRDVLTEQTIRDFLAALPGGGAWDAQGRYKPALGDWDPAQRRYELRARVKGGDGRAIDKDVIVRFLNAGNSEDRRRFDDRLALGGAGGIWLDDSRGLDEDWLDRAARADLAALLTSGAPREDHWLATRPDIARFHRPGMQFLPQAAPGSLEELIAASYRLPDQALPVPPARDLRLQQPAGQA